MALDFPQTPAGRMELYVAALRGAQERGEPQCCGRLVGVKRKPVEGFVRLHCAAGIIARDVFEAQFEELAENAPGPVSQIMQDLVHFGFDQNHIFRMNDREDRSFGEIADALEKVLEPA